MIFILDIKTIAIQAVITHAFFTIILLIFNLQKTQVKGFSKLIKACFFIFIGLIFLVNRDTLPIFLTIIVANTLPIFLTIIVANTLMIYGLISLSHGVRIFSQCSKKLFNIELLSIIPFILLFVYLSYYNPNINMRIVIFSLYTIYSMYKMIKAIVYQKKEITKHISNLICTLLTLSLCFEVYKIFVALFGPKLDKFFEANNNEGIRQILLQLTLFMLIMGIFLISNKIYENELEVRSMTDSLTGLFNRNAFDQLAKMKISKAERNNMKLGLAICDIDHFKRVNDSYGHSIGDKILVEFSNLIKNNLRIEDLLGRYGGEEFTILIFEMEESNMILKLEEIRKEIEKNIFLINSKNININASFGGIVFNPNDMDIKKAFNIADNALYKAKELGRNKVIVQSI